MFSAVGYFFGKKLNKDLHIPIGLINSNWGGSPAEVWTPSPVVNEDPIMKQAADQLKPADWWPHVPGKTFNAMIAPITNHAIAGAIWYQGESNALTASTYSALMNDMVDAWRKAWNRPFPFYYVQIAPFSYGNKNIGALLREAQYRSMSHGNMGMVVISDLVDDTTNIHPKNKKDVGLRLANWALAENYHKDGISYKSPFYQSIHVEKEKAIIDFTNANQGLISKDKKITELYISGSDKLFHPAEGKIEKGKLIVWSKEVAAPVAVRYGFSNTAMGNLFSADGLPVGPFRTDDWTVDTSNK
jgi:sialate O-acetylesterase